MNQPIERSVLAGLLTLSLSGAVAAAPQDTAPEPKAELVTPAPAPPSALTLRERISGEAIREAVRDTLAADDDKPRPAPASGALGAALSGDRYREFSREFSEAKKPGCFGPDALKHQPAGYSTKNWNFSAGGLMALPFWAAAIARGKCN